MSDNKGERTGNGAFTVHEVHERKHLLVEFHIYLLKIPSTRHRLPGSQGHREKSTRYTMVMRIVKGTSGGRKCTIPIPV